GASAFHQQVFDKVPRDVGRGVFRIALAEDQQVRMPRVQRRGFDGWARRRTPFDVAVGTLRGVEKGGLRACLASAQAAFLDAAQRADRNVEWRAPPGPAIETATLHARHADLLILGQRDPEDPASYVARHFIEDLLMESGRP